MNAKIVQLLEGKEDNHMLPFFWQHGEDEETLREYMKVIDEANCKAVCVESRPHPDFCGEKWWQDMDVILDEARKRNMKVWILDDSHFPTGVANGAVKDAPLQLHRQSVCKVEMELSGEAGEVTIDLAGKIPGEFEFMGQMEQYVLPMLVKDAPHYEDDHAIAVTAVSESGEVVYGKIKENICTLQKPAGNVKVYIIGLSRNLGPHRDFINMLDPESCRILLDAVYEKHYEHYKNDFGTTIEGFFSDEPELGNGHLYFYDNVLGTNQDLPFSQNLPKELKKRLGDDWANRLYLLWDNTQDENETAYVRHQYMDAITKLVRESFSRQIGDWCREHGVRYIGHMIEDGNAHARTGSSLGHYFRGLDGQDMAGIDDIGGQVLPQGEEEPSTGVLGVERDGTFYHFQLANLAASAAGIEPDKHGDSMCEIFGNYGWAEGTRLEKYLADHFMVNGINHFVPHAFSPAPFPDIDCPPHFYAHGHNAQYRAFGNIMTYMNRVSTLISGGKRMTKVGVLYHGESEWAGKAELSQYAIRKLMEVQIAVDTIPSDVFAEREHYNTKVEKDLVINENHYEAFVIPEASFVTKALAEGVKEMLKHHIPVFVIGGYPTGISDERDESICNELLTELKKAKLVTLEQLSDEVEKSVTADISVSPKNPYVRALHYKGEAEIYYLVNEGKDAFTGEISIAGLEDAYCYDAYLNRVYPLKVKDGKIVLTMLPLYSYIIVKDYADDKAVSQIELESGKWIYDGKASVTELKEFKRSLCEGSEYPSFRKEASIMVPDALAEEEPEFSGFARYETSFEKKESGACGLYIEDACEAVEVFLNDASLGIQIVPPFAYDLKDAVVGDNKLRIEVATTLERQCYNLIKDDPRTAWRGVTEPVGGSGLTGKVKLYIE